MAKMRIGLVENFGLDFLNFRVPLVKYLEDQGYTVYAIIPIDEYTQDIIDAGVKTLTYRFKKNSLNPFSFIDSMFSIARLRNRYSLNLIHAFRLQPNILSNFACAFNKNVKVVNHITGLGYAFTRRSFSSTFFRVLTSILYQVAFGISDRIIVQNNFDLVFISKFLFATRKISLIEGSGINLRVFNRSSIDRTKQRELLSKMSASEDDIIVTFIGRLLTEKGIMEFLAASEKLLQWKPQLKFAIAGWLDIDNPSCISSSEFYNLLGQNKNIVYLGKINEIRELLFCTTIFVLPTYREGFPRSVLEAMAMEVPVVTTNVPGSRDAVQHEINGILVPPMNIPDLVAAIKILVSDPSLQKKYGKRGRELAEERYSNQIIFKKIQEVYEL